MEDDHPLTISYRKLSDWLVQRGKLPADWRKRVAAIRARAREVSVLSGGPGEAEGFDYWAACSHSASLQDIATRGLLGNLTGPAGDWAKITKAYENKGVYLGESAALLVTLAAYEVPAMKAQAGKLQQQLGDLERKIAEHRRSAASAAQQHAQECKRLGIQGTNPASEILRLPTKLPQLLLSLHASHISNAQVSEAQELYGSFCQLGHQQGGQGTSAKAAAAPAAEHGEDSRGGVLQSLKWAMHSPPGSDADITVPGAQQECLDSPASQGEAAPQATPDQGGEEGSTPAAGIQWDVDLSAAADEASAGGQQEQGDDSASPGEIQWDIEVPEAGAEAEEGESATEGPSIDWDIEDVEPEAAFAAEPPSNATADGAQQQDTFVARFSGDEAWRLKLQDDLHELAAFLQQRRAEMLSPSYEALSAGLPQPYQEATAEQVAAMLTAVKAAVAAVGDARLAQLISILSSPSYRQFTLQRLEASTGQEAKFHRLAAEARQRQQGVQRALVEDTGRLSEATKRLQDVRGRLELRIAELFGGRRVQILGL